MLDSSSGSGVVISFRSIGILFLRHVFLRHVFLRHVFLRDDGVRGGGMR